jgi:hypothetical protein
MGCDRRGKGHHANAGYESGTHAAFGRFEQRQTNRLGDSRQQLSVSVRNSLIPGKGLFCGTCVLRVPRARGARSEACTVLGHVSVHACSFDCCKNEQAELERRIVLRNKSFFLQFSHWNTHDLALSVRSSVTASRGAINWTVNQKFIAFRRNHDD